MTATVEARRVRQTAVTEQISASKATREAKDLVTATFRAGMPATPTRQLGQSVPGWLIADSENITRRMQAIQPYLQSCPFTQAERSRYIRRLERFTANANDIADDMDDGYVDDYSMEELVSITNDGFEIIGELELLCR